MSSGDHDPRTLPLGERPTPRRSQRTRKAVRPPSPSDSSSDDERDPGSVLREGSQEDEVPPSVPPLLNRHDTTECDDDVEGEVYFTGDDVDAQASIESSSSGMDDVPLETIELSKRSRKKGTSKNVSQTRKSNLVSGISMFFFRSIFYLNAFPHFI